MRKHIILSLLLLLLLLAACGSAAEPNGATDTESEETTAAVEDSGSTTEEESKDSGSAQTGKTSVATGSNPEEASIVREQDHVKGTDDPTVTIIEYGDFQ